MILRNLNEQFKAKYLALTLISIGFAFLAYMYSKNQIKTPVTDDWLYLGVGTHRTSLLSAYSFELINGHQQFLVKLTIWMVGFFPGTYFSYIWYVNAAFAFFGISLLIISQMSLLQSKNLSRHVFILVLILCNFKPLYLYMSLTGTGLCMTMLFYGVYYFAANKMSGHRSQVVKTLCASLAPFATGFGISLAIAHLLEILFSASEIRALKSSKQKILEVLLPTLGLLLAYVLPTIYSVLNPRSPENGSSKLSNLLDIIAHPIRVVHFISGLLGSTITPSSHFDPWLPVVAGFLILVLFVWSIALTYGLVGFIKTVLFNKTPFLGGLIFVLMLVVFRGLGEHGALDESVAPRYVMGTSLLIFGSVVLILKEQNYNSKLRIPFSLLLIVLLCSPSGLKTGLEWLSVRNSQTTILRSCIEDVDTKVSNCLDLIRPIEEGESTDKDNLKDLRDLSEYLENRQAFPSN